MSTRPRRTKYGGATPRPDPVKPGRIATCTSHDPDYSEDEVEFFKAVEKYKRENRRPFPTWREVLQVIRALGYRKVT